MTVTTEGAPQASGAPQDILDRILTVMNTIGSAWIFVLMIMIDTDAFSRTLFTHPIHGVNELVEMSIVAIVFMQIGDATRRGRLTRSDGFYGMIQRRQPRMGHAMGAIFDLLGVSKGAVALTKIDRVPEESAAEVAEEIEVLFAGT
ncbi:MAG: TRAP transporter small permease subunit, partial [Alphaproteobacteria bacterium]